MQLERNRQLGHQLINNNVSDKEIPCCRGRKSAGATGNMLVRQEICFSDRMRQEICCCDRKYALATGCDRKYAAAIGNML
jgi:hypothetical protein